MGTDWTTIFLISAIVCGLLGWAIGSNKGAGAAGLILGALFGLIGVLIVALMKPSAEHLAATAPAPVRPGKWWPDPYGRHAQRYYNGTEWTNHIIDADGNQGIETL